MAMLSSELRTKLERTIIQARDIAEAGACAALEGMAVHNYEPYPHQSVGQRKLRNHLRARARQLGDVQNPKGRLEITHLAHECAYEHWHRMLFARFLAENDLLIEPAHGVSISLQECEELAKIAASDLWTYASRCAQQMLPQIFRPDDPLLQVTLAPEHQVQLERLLAALDPAVFKADDSLGWVYQFWQSSKKDQVNASGQKITGDTLPAVTQLFTEHYMVLFLLHNTIGAWHAGKVLAANPQLALSAANEDQLRKAVALTALGGYSFDYLRFIRDDENSPWRPAAGSFSRWPKTAAMLKVLDPSCGSGHFLTAVFDLIVRLRMQEENLTLAHAIDAVLKDNIFGLEIDARCTQIAAFNLALAAWKLTAYRPLGGMHIACCGIGPQSSQQQWLDLLEQSKRPIPPLARTPIKEGLLNLHSLFSKATTLGSLIDPAKLPKDLFAADYETLQPYLADIISAETGDNDIHERAIAASGMVKAAELLAGEYTLVITNVPYLGSNKHDDTLKAHLENHYSQGKADLATAFVLRSLELCASHGTTALVTPQNWLFLTTYKKLREGLLRNSEWNFVVRLGEHAFESSAAAGAFGAMLSLSNATPTDTHIMAGIDVSAQRGQQPIYAAEKATLLRDPLNEKSQIALVQQADQLKNPGAAITFVRTILNTRLQEFATAYEGAKTVDIERFRHFYWELAHIQEQQWWLHNSSPTGEGLISGCHYVSANRSDGSPFQKNIEAYEQSNRKVVAWLCGNPCWNKIGVSVAWMSNLPASLYIGSIFDNSAAVILPKSVENLSAIYCFITSGEYTREMRKINQKIQVAAGMLDQVPFDLEHWQKVAAEKYPNGLPEPESDDPTQWLFHGRPEASAQPLQAAVARMLGYRWPAELDPDMRLSARARELVKKCDELLKFADDDGIVCIPSVRGEEPASERLLAVLAACGIKPDVDLDQWLRDSFFEEHCKLFHHRPFIWHIWDGRRRDGFHALINYHKLAEGGGRGRKLLESLTYSYLGEWINRRQDGVRQGEGGAEDRLAAATELQKQLIAIIEGQSPLDIFVRWKPLHKQPIGWEPDINDGVRMNIRPFMTGSLNGGRAGAGILRWKPNIKWDKDRGTEPARLKGEYPWFWGWDGNTTDFMGAAEFKGERFNACHYKIDAKQQARDAAGRDNGK